MLTLPAQPALAQDPYAPPSPRHEAERVISAELAMSDALAQRSRLLGAPAPTGVMDRVRLSLGLEAADFAYRSGARQEELRVYELASYSSVEAAVVPLLPQSVSRPVEDAIAGLHSLYALAGFDQYYLVHAHFSFAYARAAPVATLRGYYLEAQKKYGVDAVLSGHNHFYARMVPQDGIRYFVSGGGGNAVYNFKNSPGYVATGGGFFHFLYVRITPETFEYYCVDRDGHSRDAGWWAKGDAADHPLPAGSLPPR